MQHLIEHIKENLEVISESSQTNKQGIPLHLKGKSLNFKFKGNNIKLDVIFQNDIYDDRQIVTDPYEASTIKDFIFYFLSNTDELVGYIRDSTGANISDLKTSYLRGLYSSKHHSTISIFSQGKNEPMSAMEIILESNTISISGELEYFRFVFKNNPNLKGFKFQYLD